MVANVQEKDLKERLLFSGPQKGPAERHVPGPSVRTEISKFFSPSLQLNLVKFLVWRRREGGL